MKIFLPVRSVVLKRHAFKPPAEGRLRKIRLDFNENTAGCSPAVIRALRRVTPKQLAMYPEYESSIKDFAHFFGVRSDELLISNGADDAIRAFFDVFVDHGARVLLCEPTFPMYRYYAEIFGAKIDSCRYDSEMRFPFDEVLVALRRRPRLVFIANPNNPTGTLLSCTAIERLLKAATHTAMVIDEAYVEFAGVTALPLIHRYPQLFLVRTFSKAAGLAGLRLGAIIACADSLENVRRVSPPFPVNFAALVAAKAAIRDLQTMRRYVRNVTRLREWISAELQQLGIATFPSAGNFLLANFGPAGPRLFQRLAAQGFLLRDRTKEMGPGFVRITVGTDREMESLIKAIRRMW
jgi:histidinol-phosphate aminotransferase